MRVANLLVAAAPTVDAAAIAAAYAALLPGAAPLLIEATAAGAVLRPADADLAIALEALAEPLPAGEAEAAARRSIGCLGRDWQPPPHAGRLQLARDGSTTLRRDHALTICTAVAAAAAEAAGAVGIHWPAAAATHEPGFFHAVAARAVLQPPVAVWTGLARQRQDGRLRLVSRGLREQLDLPDVLLNAPADQEQEALSLLLELADAMVRQDRAPTAGEAIAWSAGSPLVAEYAAADDDGVPLLRLSLP